MDKLLFALLLPFDWVVARLWPRWGWKAAQATPAPVVDLEPAAPVDPPVALEAPPPVASSAGADQGVPEPRRRRRPRAGRTVGDVVVHDSLDAAEPGSTRWHFRSTILDRLDDYFVCMRRLKAKDPRSYALFSRTGFAVPADVWFAHDRARPLPPLGPERPTFGGVLCARWTDREAIYPSFAYFHKLGHAPARVQAWPGEVYRLTCVYDNRSDLSEPCTCHLGVQPDGSTVLLKEPVSSWQTLETGRRHGRRQRLALRQTTWAYPRWVTMDHPDADGAHWASWLLQMALLTYQDSVAKIVVRAHQGGCVAAFGIDLARGPAFFKDRDKETALARDGKRKRIFHAVRQHVRQVHGGPTTVQAHYRGLRTFDWQGRRIHIVLPEMTRVLAMDVPAEEVPQPTPPDQADWLDEGQVGERFAAKLDQ